MEIQESLNASSISQQAFVEALRIIQKEINTTAKSKGWWEEDRNNGEMIALIHSELSEGLENLRHGCPPSNHIPDFMGIEEELADVVIRVLDMSEARGYRLPEAILAKIAYNKARPFKHGGKKF